MWETLVGSLGWENSPGEENDNRLQYSCLGNPTDSGAWQATVHGISKSWTQLSDNCTELATAEFSKFAGILSAALLQHHLLGLEIAQLEFYHLH